MRVWVLCAFSTLKGSNLCCAVSCVGENGLEVLVQLVWLGAFQRFLWFVLWYF